MIAQHEDRFVSERLSSNLASAIRVLDTADRALLTQDARPANMVLRLEADIRASIGPVGGAVRGDAAVESILDLAMRVADLARIAWRPDRSRPTDAELALLLDDIDAVRSHARMVIEGGFEQLSALTRLVVHADVHAAAITRTCDSRKLQCPAC